MQILSTTYQPLTLEVNTKIDYQTHPHNIIFEKLAEAAPAGAETYGVYRPNSLAQAMNYLMLPCMESSFDSNNFNNQDSTLTSAATNQMQNQISLRYEIPTKTFGGYNIDENGFMGADFLNAAHLPSHYKIHSNALQALHDYYMTPNFINSQTAPCAEFESIDLIAGISYAYNEIQDITKGKFDLKDAYSEVEIKQMFKQEHFFADSVFHTPLMRDYQNEKGEYSAEGILLMFAFNSDSFAKAESPYTQLSEYGKFQRGMPSSYQPNDLDSTKKQKTPEELKKEMQDSLMEYYLKAIDSNENKGETKNLSKEVNDFVNAQIRDSLKSMRELHKL